MKRIPMLISSLAIFMSMVACGFGFSTVNLHPNAAQTASIANPMIVAVTLAKGVQGEDNTPLDPTTVFGVSDIIHAVTQIKDAPAETHFTAAWYAVDVGDVAPPNTLIDTVEVVTDGSRNIDFNLYPPTDHWPTGAYRVDIALNGQPAAQAKFTVQ
jgi:hypothetical protein